MKTTLLAGAFWTWIECHLPNWNLRHSVINFRRGPLAALALSAFLLAGCITTDGPGSVAGSCKSFEAPQYAIRGATQHDQDWIDPQIESGVGACHWARPAPRPAEWDAPMPVKAKAAPAPVKKKKKVGWIWRLKWNRPVPVAAPTELPAVEVTAPEPPPAPPPAPRSAIDILLNPNGGQ